MIRAETVCDNSDTLLWREESGQARTPVVRNSVRFDGDRFEYHIDNFERVSGNADQTQKRDSVAMIVQLAQGGAERFRRFPPDSIRAVFVAG